jgi:hypothetical protein
MTRPASVTFSVHELGFGMPSLIWPTVSIQLLLVRAGPRRAGKSSQRPTSHREPARDSRAGTHLVELDCDAPCPAPSEVAPHIGEVSVCRAGLSRTLSVRFKEEA